LTTVTSVILVTHRRTTTHSGTFEQLERQCRDTFLHNVLLGWWGFPFGLVWTPIALIRNRRALRELRSAVAGAGR
jgi:hypothetical protein